MRLGDKIREKKIPKFYSIFQKYYQVTRIFYSKYKLEYFISSSFIVLSSALIFPVPVFTRRLIDVIYINGPPKDILKILLIVIVLLFLSNLLSFIGNQMFFRLNSKVNLLLRNHMVTKILKSKFELFEKYNSGYLLSRVNNDPAYLNTLFGQQLIEIFQNLVIIVVSIVGILYLSVKLALFVLLILPLLTWFVIYFSKKMRKIFPIFLERKAHETSTLQESLNSFMFLKIALREIVGIRRFFSSALKTHKINLKYGKYHFGNLATSSFFTQFTPIFVFAFGGYWVILGKMKLSTLIAFNMFMAYLFSSLTSLLNTNITLQVALSALERIHEILNYPQETYTESHSRIRELVLSNINFKYGNRHVLKDINLSAILGEKIGIAGQSGQGKTTLLKIISGALYNFGGEFMVNGKEIDIQTIIGLRRKIAFVSQEPLLLRGTFKYNLKLFNPLANDREIYRIMEKLGLHEFIVSLPDGYETIIDMKKFDLSAGQKQRIAFARAYLKKPDVLLLDEFTSNLDEESESALLSVVSELKDMIVIMVSHRYKPLLVCDRIYLIKDGKSIEVKNVEEIRQQLA